MIDKKIVDWLNLKSETDEDMLIVGMIVGTISALNQKINRLKKYDKERDIALHARLIAETRKETAKKVLQAVMLKAWSHNTDENGNVWNYCITVGELNEIAKQFSTEVEE